MLNLFPNRDTSFLDCLHICSDGRERSLRSLQKHTAKLGERESTVASVEELNVKFVFQRFDLVR